MGHYQKEEKPSWPNCCSVQDPPRLSSLRAAARRPSVQQQVKRGVGQLRVGDVREVQLDDQAPDAHQAPLAPFTDLGVEISTLASCTLGR